NVEAGHHQRRLRDQPPVGQLAGPHGGRGSVIAAADVLGERLANDWFVLLAGKRYCGHDATTGFAVTWARRSSAVSTRWSVSSSVRAAARRSRSTRPSARSSTSGHA